MKFLIFILRFKVKIYIRIFDAMLEYKNDYTIGWGGGYTDEPISKIISAIQSSPTVRMDRWQLSVTRDSSLPATEEKGEDQLPRSANVVNNYFSLGVDAQIALQFHEAREANPQKFNSRIRNKMYYGQAGGKVN